MGRQRDRLLDELENLYRVRGVVFPRVARAITGDRETAAEAVQDGFVNAIRSRASFRGEGPLEAWVWRAVVNAARKAMRPVEHELPDLEAPAPEFVTESHRSSQRCLSGSDSCSFCAT